VRLVRKGQKKVHRSGGEVDDQNTPRKQNTISTNLKENLLALVHHEHQITGIGMDLGPLRVAERYSEQEAQKRRDPGHHVGRCDKTTTGQGNSANMEEALIEMERQHAEVLQSLAQTVEHITCTEVSCA
jgi:hypothetical protein